MPLATLVLLLIQDPTLRLTPGAVLQTPPSELLDAHRLRESAATLRTELRIDRGALDRATLQGEEPPSRRRGLPGPACRSNYPSLFEARTRLDPITTAVPRALEHPV